MSIENDESLWPEGAQWYLKPKANNKLNKPFFAIDCIATSETREGTKITGEQYEVWTEFWEDIPRPPSPWPQVGDECEFSLDAGCTYQWCEVLGRHERAAWVRTRHGYSNFFIDKAMFRPTRTLRDEAVSVVKLALTTAYVEGQANGLISEADEPVYAAAAVDALLAKYDLKGKTQ